MYLDGKVYFNFRIQDYSDFLNPTDVMAFSMKENCGAAGVVFELAFQTDNRKIADLIIENNEVIFEIGESVDKANTYKAYISEHPNKETSADDSKIIVSLVATLIDMSFYTTRASETVFGTSLDMVKKMAKTYLGKDAKVEIDTPAEIEHNWLRSYETGAVTMTQAWLHMNLPKTTPILWIDTTNTAHISDIEKIKKNGVKHRFVPAQLFNPNEKGNNVEYLNNFTTKSYKFDTNLITGKNTIVNISNIESGDDTVSIPENKPDIASTSKVESGEVGNKVVDNKYQTDNVHNKFMICYYVNKLRLIQLSSHIGNLELSGFHPEINICDLVEVTGCQPNYSGRYLVNTKVTYFGANKPIKTMVAVCRDNTNSIEDSAITPKSKVVMHNQQLTDIMQSIRTLRRLTVMGTRMLDGTTKRDILGYCKTFKYNALNSFQVLGIPLNLNSSIELMASLRAMGLKIIYGIIDKYIPYPYNLLFRDLVLDGYSFKKLLSKLFMQYAPPMIRDFLIEILGLLGDLTALADALHKQNSKSLSNYNYQQGGYSTEDNENTQGNASGTPTYKEEFIPNGDIDMPIDYTQQNTENIKNITDELLENVDGVDIPIPEISLNESESLLPKDKLKEVIAEQIVDYIDGQGYLIGIGKATFLAMLLGKKPLDFNTIKLINANTGNMLYARYWGAYNGQLTKFGRVTKIVRNYHDDEKTGLEVFDYSAITLPNINVTEDLYAGDTIIINGTDESNGTFTVQKVSYDPITENSTVISLDEIPDYDDKPIKTYNTICQIDTLESHQDVTINNVEYIDVTVITLTGNYQNIIKTGDSINITNLGSRGTGVIRKSIYSKGKTTLILNTELIDYNHGTKMLQVVREIENGTSISKLSNQDFTEFYIKNSFKDIYATVPCTKIISASQGAKVWIAIPSIEKDLDFYVNSEKVDMNVIEGIDLNMYAPGGAKLYYNVYMSQGTYNSNNVTLEIRRKLS